MKRGKNAASRSCRSDAAKGILPASRSEATTPAWSTASSMAVTEVRTKAQIDAYAEAMKESVAS